MPAYLALHIAAGNPNSAPLPTDPSHKTFSFSVIISVSLLRFLNIWLITAIFILISLSLFTIATLKFLCVSFNLFHGILYPTVSNIYIWVYSHMVIYILSFLWNPTHLNIGDSFIVKIKFHIFFKICSVIYVLYTGHCRCCIAYSAVVFHEFCFLFFKNIYYFCGQGTWTQNLLWARQVLSY